MISNKHNNPQDQETKSNEATAQSPSDMKLFAHVDQHGRMDKHANKEVEKAVPHLKIALHAQKFALCTEVCRSSGLH